MLNISLVQKHLSAKCTSQGIQKFGLTILCKYIKRKTKYSKRVTRTDDCLVTSHSTMLTLNSSEISPTQFYICPKTGCGIRYFLTFETENWICWLLRHYVNFLCELNFIGLQIFNQCCGKAAPYPPVGGAPQYILY